MYTFHNTLVTTYLISPLYHTYHYSLLATMPSAVFILHIPIHHFFLMGNRGEERSIKDDKLFLEQSLPGKMIYNQLRNLALRSGRRSVASGLGLRRSARTETIRSLSGKTTRTLATTSNPEKLHISTVVEESTIVPPEGLSISLSNASRDESKFGTRPIYLDVQATTPTDPRVLDKMLEFLTGLYGNPHSSTHSYGWETDKEVEKARKYVADVIKADPKEIIFTSGATESNNMAIKGVPRFYKKTKKHIITTQTEHKCVLDSARHMQDEGFEVTYLPVTEEGLINLEDLKKAIRKDTILVSVMAVNNEIGVIQPLKEIGKICRENKIFFHTDAAQAYGKIEIDVDEMNIDLMSISSHKIYGPKGIGAAYVRRRPRVRLDPIITGGGQERGLRSGTLAPPLVAGFGEAARLMKEEMEVSIF
jgi:cysteine desulfurase